MIEDELLKWRFKSGSKEALQRIYEKYLNFLLTLAMALLNDAGSAEDVVHDVFVSFAKSAENFKLTGNLKSYLATCVINRARDRIRANQLQQLRLDGTDSISSNSFREIAKLQGASVNTILGRYRYGLNKLRSILDCEIEK